MIGIMGAAKVAMVVGAVAAVGAAVLHYRGLVNEIEVRRANEARLEAALDVSQESQKAVLERVEEINRTMRRNAAAVDKLADEQRAARQVVEDANKRLSSVNIEQELGNDPQDLMRRINRGTDRAFRVLECASGSSDCVHADRPPRQAAPASGAEASAD